ncbi:MAG: hypothetical protein IJO06_06010 [Thermoguttaceae bacterium]|nr:hypothetical protein [Thermoguttaceae bacterium]
MSGGSWRRNAAKLGLWIFGAAASACVATFSFERTLSEVAGAREAGVEADVRGASPSPSERLLREAIVRLEGLRSASADLDFEARLFGERYFGRGRYEETSEASSAADASRRSALENVRYRLRASIARGSAKEARDDGEENVLEIVCDCDRQALWTYSSVEGTKTLTRIDVAELSNGLASLSPGELAAVGVEGPCAMNGLPGLGGLAGTLRRLSAVYRFEPRVEKAPPFKGTEVVKITGRARRAFWDASKRSLGVDKLEPYLSENLPGNVEIYLGADWPFPYKIVYFSLAENEEKTRNDVFTVEYSSVVRNDATIRPENFNYNQPQITFERVTSKYVESLISDAE